MVLASSTSAAHRRENEAIRERSLKTKRTLGMPQVARPLKQKRTSNDLDITPNPPLNETEKENKNPHYLPV